MASQNIKTVLAVRRTALDNCIASISQERAATIEYGGFSKKYRLFWHDVALKQTQKAEHRPERTADYRKRWPMGTMPEEKISETEKIFLEAGRYLLEIDRKTVDAKAKADRKKQGKNGKQPQQQQGQPQQNGQNPNQQNPPPNQQNPKHPQQQNQNSDGKTDEQKSLEGYGAIFLSAVSEAYPPPRYSENKVMPAYRIDENTELYRIGCRHIIEVPHHLKQLNDPEAAREEEVLTSLVDGRVFCLKTKDHTQVELVSPLPQHLKQDPSQQVDAKAGNERSERRKKRAEDVSKIAKFMGVGGMIATPVIFVTGGFALPVLAVGGVIVMSAVGVDAIAKVIGKRGGVGKGAPEPSQS